MKTETAYSDYSHDGLARISQKLQETATLAEKAYQQTVEHLAQRKKEQDEQAKTLIKTSSSSGDAMDVDDVGSRPPKKPFLSPNLGMKQR
jgi:hypothetical protein